MSEQRMTAGARPGQERALLVGVDLVDAPDAWPIEESLAELGRLAETAGLAVVGTLTQRLRRPSPRTVIGPGKVEELAARTRELGVDLVVFDDELSPGQARNLEDALAARVIDRTGLILDIFAQHAHTREGRIQVGLAQYSYLLTRLRSLKPGRPARGGSAGGVGLRGPGETQLEQDRRTVMRRVSELRAELEEVRRHRELYREQRRQGGVPVVALVGYTNAGKSTLLNALTQAGVRAEDRLFATLDPVTRQLALPGGQELLLTDTVGFIRKLPPQLVAAFRATLEEIAEADLVLHVLDASHPAAVEQSQTVLETLVQLRAANRPRLTVLNKVDQLDDPAAEVPALARELGLAGGYVAVSAREGRGLDRLLEAIRDELQGRMTPVEALIPYEHGELAALWHQHGVVEREQHEEGGTRIVGRLPAALAARLAPFEVRRRRERAVGERRRREG
jgi:GTP-binding protein HflX